MSKFGFVEERKAGVTDSVVAARVRLLEQLYVLKTEALRLRQGGFSRKEVESMLKEDFEKVDAVREALGIRWPEDGFLAKDIMEQRSLLHRILFVFDALDTPYGDLLFLL